MTVLALTLCDLSATTISFATELPTQLRIAYKHNHASPLITHHTTTPFCHRDHPTCACIHKNHHTPSTMSLSAQEISRLGSDLTKAAASSEPGDVMIKMLNELRKGVTASEDLLRSTKIGITVNKFKTHRNPEVAKVAADLVLKWRNDVKAAGGGSGSKGAASPAAGSGKNTPVSGTPSRTASAGKTNGEKVDGAAKGGFKASVPLDKRTSATDKVDTAKTGNDIRDNCLKLMYDGLCNSSEERESALCYKIRRGMI